MELFQNVHGEEDMSDVHTPLDEDRLKKLKKNKFSDITEEIIGHQIDNCCAICQDEYEPNSEVVILPCDGHHMYHEHCINQWLSQMSKKCPICKADLEEIINIDDYTNID